MTRYALLTQISEANALPDGTIITWLPVMDDPTSEAVAFFRKLGSDATTGAKAIGPETWLSPGNGWEPESLDVLRFPVKVIALGEVRPGDFVPDIVSEAEFASDQLTIGPSDRVTALNAAARIWAGEAHNMGGFVQADQVTAMAEAFIGWLSRDPLVETLQTLFDRGIVAAVEAPFRSSFDSRRDGAQS